ncbi:hypothetical protein [Stutzerimonas stutzeri]|uniref:hypothetical protein n=1 Tax=Stutzerimonas stutzeri TaxID=316 RepID=UPI0015E485F4|nr:hypothetical protein [Stutzerimonas stutzeri]MBA1280246.1 hypothetical protein [Stutzerimonas stutzeri]
MKTTDVIRDRAIGLLQTYRREATEPLSDSVDVGDVLCWLNRRVREHGLSMTTAKCYRRWLASFLEGENHPQASMMRNWAPPGSHEEVLAEDLRDAEALRPAALKVESVVTNSRYLAHLDKPAYTALMHQLLSADSNGGQRYSAGPVSALMFTATMMTGLRPMEWPSSRYLESFTDPETMMTLGPVLETHTLKQSNRREDNPLRDKRYLVLDEWPKDQLETLKGFMAEVAHAGDDFTSLYNKIRMTINRAWKRVQKDHWIEDKVELPRALSEDEKALGVSNETAVSIYTARHIFAEETRRSIRFTRFELAAMLGHSMLTNQVYYGPRDTSCEREYDFVLPRPWPGDAKDIQLWDRKVNPLRHRFAQGDLFGGHMDDAEMAREEKDGVANFYMR